MDRPVVLISALEHYGYCRRQAALIHVDDVWVENEHTQRGRRGHRRVDEGRSRLERGVLVLRNLPLYSERYGLSGKADVVEVYAGGLVPVEYKVAFRFHRAAELQLCAQAICLEEMSGSRVVFGYVWLAGQRRRMRVDFHDELRQATLEAIEDIRLAVTSGTLPPAVDDARCGQCQLEPHCMPHVVALPTRIRAYMDEVVFGCGS
nr:MAG: CRISPR-associated protein Cas4 [Actinomycetota bacterium]